MIKRRQDSATGSALGALALARRNASPTTVDSGQKESYPSQNETKSEGDRICKERRRRRSRGCRQTQPTGSLELCQFSIILNLQAANNFALQESKAVRKIQAPVMKYIPTQFFKKKNIAQVV
jgi:hypothetical protein